MLDQPTIQHLFRVIKQTNSAQITPVSVELLQICCTLITTLSSVFSEFDYKKTLIKFGWDFLISEDKIVKNIAYIFACKFIITFGLPLEKIIQIYISLLKSQEYNNQHDNDAKILSRKALDILIPFMP